MCVETSVTDAVYTSADRLPLPWQIGQRVEVPLIEGSERGGPDPAAHLGRVKLLIDPVVHGRLFRSGEDAGALGEPADGAAQTEASPRPRHGRHASATPRAGHGSS